MTTSGAHGRQAPVTERLAPVEDTDTVYYAPREGDLAMLGLLLVVVLGTGAYTWHQLGGASAIGRAIFFGLLLFCVLWVAIVYTFKLSFGVIVGPHGLSLTRGPWRTELSWSETARLVERTETSNARAYRWVVAMAYDTRRLQVREDMVSDYERFRQDVYLRYRNWQDHGGTWGTAASGPFAAHDEVRSRLTWLLIGMTLLLLPGLYFTLFLPETRLLGPIILLGAAVFAVFVIATWLRRQTYAVDNHAVSAQRPFRAATVLRWRAVTKVERVRHPFGGLIRLAIVVGNALLDLAARGDSRVRSFPWSPRVPEYLVLRGGGHQVRIHLHRLARPDELLAWVEFYERIARRATRPVSKSQPIPATLALESPEQPMPTWDAVLTPNAGNRSDVHSVGDAPRDPWAATTIHDQRDQREGRDGPPTQPTASRPPLPEVFPPAAYTPTPRNTFETEHHFAASTPGSMPTEDDDAWLRETQAHLRASRPGVTPPTGAPTTGAVSGPITGPATGDYPQMPTQLPAAPPSGPHAPGHPAQHSTRPVYPAEQPSRPSVPSRPLHPTEQAMRPPVPTHPAQPSRPLQPPPTQPRPTRLTQPVQPTRPPMPVPSTPTNGPTVGNGAPEHDDGFDQPSLDFQRTAPPQFPRFGPAKRDE